MYAVGRWFVLFEILYFFPQRLIDGMIDKIFLIGYRAAGKSTVGKVLAQRLGFTFLDTDQMVCQAHGGSVQEIIDELGWQGFRHSENEMLCRANRGKQLVVATGGGAVLHENSWKTICQQSLVVWLYADQEVIIERLSAGRGLDQGRPNLTENPLEIEVKQVLQQRTPLYQKISHMKIDTGKDSLETIVEKITAAYQEKDISSLP